MQKKVRIAVIGTSPSIAHMHMQGIIDNKDAVLAAICDIDEKTLGTAMEKFSAERAVTDYRELVNSKDIDAVVIATPDPLHLEMTSAFLKAGKHVLCEKPMALSLEECDEMMRIEKENDKILMIGQLCRFTPAFVKAKEIVESGQIGDLMFVESEYAHNYKNVEGTNSWRKIPERHGFLGGGCHALDLLRWIAGDPEEVMAYANHKSLVDWPTDDTLIAIYRFPNNVAGKVFCSTGCKRNYTMRTALYGTKGTIICDNTSPTMTLFSETLPVVLEEQREGKPAYEIPQTIELEVNNHNAAGEISIFVDAILSGKKSPIPSIEGASTVAACCATIQASQEGKVVKIQYPQV